MIQFLQDFRGQLSWGRFCSAVALCMALVVQFSGADAEHLALWLAVAVGNYTASKVAEAFHG